MKRCMITTSSDGTRDQIDYSMLTATDIRQRMGVYEDKYGAPLKQYIRTFSCDHASHEEVFDLMDWETLADELTERSPKSKAKNGRKPAYQHWLGG